MTFVTDRPGHDARYAIDASKIQLELGWQPQESCETGIRKTVQWCLDDHAWCEHVLDGSYRLERIGTSSQVPQRCDSYSQQNTQFGVPNWVSERRSG